MTELSYKVSAAWSGTGKAGEGTLVVGDHTVPYSVPANMGGKGKGASPETLLISAVTACYSGTLYHFLQKRRLPVAWIEVATEGFVADYPEKPRYSRIVVSPTIVGGAADRQDDYTEAARLARDHCFIGQTVAAGGLTYEVGTVTVRTGADADQAVAAPKSGRGAGAGRG